MRRKQNDENDWQRVNDARSQISRRLNDARDAAKIREAAPEEPELPQRELRAGDTVLLKKLGTKATVISPPDKDGNVALQAGILRVTAKAEEVRLVEGAKVVAPVFTGTASVPKGVSAQTELDLRGMASDEAVLELERFIDGAVLSKLNTVSVIHGKGTGTLRTAVSLALRKNPSVKDFRLGRYGEGENGVTIVELK
jgi:DNA mismatch repair protein MutS2